MKTFFILLGSSAVGS